MLQAMKMNKSCIPVYLHYRDKGYMYFPDNSSLPFLYNFDTSLKEVVNEEGFCQHGDTLAKVTLFMTKFVKKGLHTQFYELGDIKFSTSRWCSLLYDEIQSYELSKLIFQCVCGRPLFINLVTFIFFLGCT